MGETIFLLLMKLLRYQATAVVAALLCSFQKHFFLPRDFADGVNAFKNKHFATLARKMQVLAKRTREPEGCQRPKAAGFIELKRANK
jgi:hypothetical protein